MADEYQYMNDKSNQEKINECKEKLNSFKSKLNELDLKDSEVVIDLLNHEILKKENYSEIFNKTINDEPAIDYIYKITESLTTMASDLIKVFEKEINETKQQYINSEKNYKKFTKKGNKNIDIKQDVIAIISAIAVIAQTFGLVKLDRKTIEPMYKGPSITTETYDENGLVNKKTAHKTVNNISFEGIYHGYDEQFVESEFVNKIIFYSKRDPVTGLRTKTTYSLPTDVDSSFINEIDLKTLQTISSETIYDSGSLGLPDSECRLLEKNTLDFNNIQKDEDIESGIIIIYEALYAFLFILIDIVLVFVEYLFTELVLDVDLEEALDVFFDDAIIIYSRCIASIEKIRKTKDYEKYQKVINTLSNRIHIIFDKLLIEYNSLYEKINNNQKRILHQKIDEIDKQKENYEKIRIENEKMRQNMIANIMQTFNTLNQMIDKYSDTFDNNSKNFHNVIIPDDLLFEKEEDHIKINPIWLDNLQYIDFSMCDETNMAATNIDFSITNFRIDPQKVYKKDISNSKFSKNNLSEFQTFSDIKMDGTIFEDYSYGKSVGLGI